MAFSEAKVIASIQLDTKDAIRKADELKKANAGIAESYKKTAADADTALNSQIAKLAKAAVAIYGVSAAFNAVRESIREYAKHAQLEAAAGSISIEKLRSATQGLAREHELLTLAAAGNTAQWKLNQEQLNNVARLSLELSRKGHDLEQVMTDVAKAIRSGTVEELKKYGLVIADIKPGQEAVNKLLEIAAKSTGGVGTAADGAVAGLNKFDDALGRLERRLSAGRLLSDLSQASTYIANMFITGDGSIRPGSRAHDLEELRNSIELMKRQRDFTMYDSRRNELNKAIEQSEAALKLLSERAFNLTQSEQSAGARAALQQGLRGSGGLLGAGLPPAPTWTDGLGDLLKIDPRTMNELYKWFQQNAPPARSGGGRGPARPDGSAMAIAGVNLIGGITQLSRRYDLTGNVFGTDVAAPDISGIGGVPSFANWTSASKSDLEFNRRQVEELSKIIDQTKMRKRESVLSNLFGPISEFNKYAAGFGILQNAVTAAVQAWVTGSKSIGAAFKETIVAGLQSMTVEFAGQALRHTLFGFGSLAFGGPLAGASAAAHFKAAAGYAAGMAAVGTLARGLGGNNAAPSITSPGGVGGGGRGGGDTKVIIIGSDFEYDNARTRTARFKRMLDRADRGRGGSGPVTYS